MVLPLVILACLGLCFGSFVNALVWRLHEAKNWITSRSQCVKCGHKLSAGDLVPLLSFLYLRGKCRYCAQPILWQYPLVELAGGLWFGASYLFWPAGLSDPGQLLLFITWLATSVGLLALFVYDLRFMILPNKIIYPTLAIASSGQLTFIAAYTPHKSQALVNLLFGLLAASGIFWLLFELSRGRWIGFGDVRLGFVAGMILAAPAKSLLMIFIASVLGTLFVIPALVTGKKNTGSRIPYGPFLIIAIAITLLFGGYFIDWYKHLVI